MMSAMDVDAEERYMCAVYLPVLTQILGEASPHVDADTSLTVVCNCAPGTLLSALHILTPLILRATREVGMDEEMEAQRGCVAEPRSYD